MRIYVAMAEIENGKTTITEPLKAFKDCEEAEKFCGLFNDYIYNHPMEQIEIMREINSILEQKISILANVFYYEDISYMYISEIEIAE